MDFSHFFEAISFYFLHLFALSSVFFALTFVCVCPVQFMLFFIQARLGYMVLFGWIGGASWLRFHLPLTEERREFSQGQCLCQDAIC